MDGTDDENEVFRISENWNEPVQFTVRVVGEGNCRADHKKAQTFEFEWNTPEGMCGESFVGMYPVLHSLRVLGDMRELGSSERNVRVYTCPSREIQFEITATYTCNLCGQPLAIKSGEIQAQKIEDSKQNLWVRVCHECAEKHANARLEW